MPEEKSNLPEVVPTNLPPTIVTEFAQDAAKGLLAVVKKGGMIIEVRKQKYLKYEGWQTLGTFMGRAYGGPVTAGADDAEPVFEDGKFVGFKAHARAWCEGRIISEAVAYCYRSEGQWKDKPAFQLASMAQTRASSKALRNVLGWVLTLANTGIKTTPAEEMESEVIDGEVIEDGPPSDMFTQLLTDINEAQNGDDLADIEQRHKKAVADKLLSASENAELIERGKAKRSELNTG